MKKIVVVLLLVMASFALAESGIGFKGVGAQLGFAIPEDPVPGAIGFGGQIYLGEIKEKMQLYVTADYWTKSFDDDGFDGEASSFNIMAAVRYGFSAKGKFNPYVGVGLGVQMATLTTGLGEELDEWGEEWGVDTKVEVDDTDLAYMVMAGASMPLSPKLEGFAEVRYTMGFIDALGIYAGVTFLLK